jgi:hypothetical protein
MIIQRLIHKSEIKNFIFIELKMDQSDIFLIMLRLENRLISVVKE